VHQARVDFEKLKKQDSHINRSLLVYARSTFKKYLKTGNWKPQTLDFALFTDMWGNREINQNSLRKKAWKRSSKMKNLHLVGLALL